MRAANKCPEYHKDFAYSGERATNIRSAVLPNPAAAAPAAAAADVGRR